MNYRKAAAEAVASALNSQQITAEQAERLMTVPPNPEMGDIAFPCFSLAKQFRKAPPQIAAELQRSILESPEAGSIFLKVEAVGGYLNFYLKRGALVRSVISEVLSRGEDYGKTEEGKGKRILVELSLIHI